MTGLQETFYIMGIIFMSLMLLLIVALVAAVFVIRSKIVKIERNIEAKINSVTNIAEKGGELLGAASSSLAKRAKKALNK